MKKIEIDGYTLCYEDSGPDDGIPVILMHGWGCSHATVKSIANALNDSCKVYNIDLPGHGESPEPETIWGIEEFTSLVEKFIIKLRISLPIIVGHSFGGRISILMSSRNHVNKVVLIDAAGIKPKRKFSYYYKVYTFKAAKKVLPIILGSNLGGKCLDWWRNKVGSADYKSASAKMKAIMSKVVNEDLTSKLPKISSPTLLIWGENDTATPLKDAHLMVKHIPDAGLVTFPHAGHYSFLDNPYQFKAVIRSFCIPK